MEIDGKRASSFLALAGGFVSVFYIFHYMQVLSYVLGIYHEATSVVSTYNLTNQTVLSSLLALSSGSANAALALDLTYVLLPFALIILAVGVLWLFAKLYSRITGIVLSMASVVYLLLTIVLENAFNFHSTWVGLAAVYLGGAMPLIAGVYALGIVSVRSEPRKHAVQIGISPESPFTNMQMLSSRLMGRLSGDIKILDMHFDVSSLDNLTRLVGKNSGRYSTISVLSKKDRLGNEFIAAYKDFREELKAKNVEFDLRVLDDDDAQKQHERLLLDGSEAYKIPPLNIINKKSEHITPVNRVDAASRFEELWSRATKFDNLQR